MPVRDNDFCYLRLLRQVKHEAEKSCIVKYVGLPGEFHEEVILCEFLYLGWILEKFFRFIFEGTQEVDEAQIAWVDSFNFDECQDYVESRQDF